jgi:NAD-dependent SIR2 family protein deacetylase
VRCVCEACEIVYDEVVIEDDPSAVPPCPRCGRWLLRLRERARNKLSSIDPSTPGLPELAAIRRHT